LNHALSAGDLCTRFVVIAHRDLPLHEAARLMRLQHVGCLVVVDETPSGRIPAGLLTDRDIVTAVVAQAVDLQPLRIEDVMHGDPEVVRETDSLLDALNAMRRVGARRLPVVDSWGVLQGLLAVDDIIDLIGEEVGLLVQVLASTRREEFRRRP